MTSEIDTELRHEFCLGSVKAKKRSDSTLLLNLQVSLRFRSNLVAVLYCLVELMVAAGSVWSRSVGSDESWCFEVRFYPTGVQRKEAVIERGG